MADWSLATTHGSSGDHLEARRRSSALHWRAQLLRDTPLAMSQEDVEAARARLAHAILALAREGNCAKERVR